VSHVLYFIFSININTVCHSVIKEKHLLKEKDNCMFQQLVGTHKQESGICKTLGCLCIFLTRIIPGPLHVFIQYFFMYNNLKI